jgi:hypothetical protein
VASIVYDSCIYNVSKGDIDWDNHTFKMMLVGTGYTANKGTHTSRSNVTSEVTGTNYTSGGNAITFVLTNDTTNHRTDITFDDLQFANLTVTGIRAGVIYKNTGTASTDLLVAYVDFLSTYSPSAQNFTASFTSPLRFANTT